MIGPTIFTISIFWGNFGMCIELVVVTHEFYQSPSGGSFVAYQAYDGLSLAFLSPILRTRILAIRSLSSHYEFSV